MVNQIYEFENPYGKWKTVLFVNPIRDLYPKKLDCPSTHFRWTLFLLQCVLGDIQPDMIIVKPKSVRSVAAYRLLPEDTFGIPTGGIMLRAYDHDSHLTLT